jgi:phosphotransacetylase
MYNNGDAAEQVFRMALNGVEVAAKISGKGAVKLIAYLTAVMKDQKKTKGKARLTAMLKSGRPLDVFSVRKDI